MVITLTARDGTGLTARRAGRGQPIVLVHGSAGGLDSWDPVVPLLTDEFEVWVYARRGYPPSGQSPSGKTFADDVADVDAVLAAAGDGAHLVGASYGGTVALHAARAGSTGIRSLALFEPPLFAAGAELDDVVDRYRALVAADDVPAATRLFAEKVARVPQPILDALAPAHGAETDPAQAAEAIGCLHDLEAMAADRLDVGRWADIDVSVLLMQGSDTWPPMPTTLDGLAEALPTVTRVVLPGQSHFATHTAPRMFAETLRTFVHAHT